jgi:hypothetical protein
MIVHQFRFRNTKNYIIKLIEILCAKCYASIFSIHSDSSLHLLSYLQCPSFFSVVFFNLCHWINQRWIELQILYYISDLLLTSWFVSLTHKTLNNVITSLQKSSLSWNISAVVKLLNRSNINYQDCLLIS